MLELLPIGTVVGKAGGARTLLQVPGGRTLFCHRSCGTGGPGKLLTCETHLSVAINRLGLGFIGLTNVNKSWGSESDSSCTICRGTFDAVVPGVALTKYGVAPLPRAVFCLSLELPDFDLPAPRH